MHTELVVLSSDGDERALGGAITVALCGHWDHEGPCRWPHHTTVTARGDHLEVRTEFSAPAAEEPEVRRLVREALEEGSLRGPDGAVTRWRLLR